LEQGRTASGAVVARRGLHSQAALANFLNSQLDKFNNNNL
jgi:hypothetical protein